MRRTKHLCPPRLSQTCWNAYRLTRRKTAGYFGQTHVAVAGLEGAGGLVAMQLLQAGIGTLTLLDPFPLQQEELSLFPFLKGDDAGKARQAVFKNYLEAVFPGRKSILPRPT